MNQIRETKSEKFKRVAKRRVDAVLKKLTVLGNCANKSNYSYTKDDVEKIFKAIEDKIQELKTLFKSQKEDHFEW